MVIIHDYLIRGLWGLQLFYTYTYVQVIRAMGLQAKIQISRGRVHGLRVADGPSGCGIAFE